MKVLSLAALKRLGVVAVVLAVVFWVVYRLMIRMPGQSHEGPAPAPRLSLVDQLKRDVEMIAGGIGERNVYTPKKLERTAQWIESSLREAGYEPQRQTYVDTGIPCSNIEAERRGTGDGIVVVGAHYDSVQGCPGANDNGSGVAATLALARMFQDAKPARTLRFVLFVNEEPPWFQTDEMGSLVYAKRCRERDENITAMIALETLGYFTEEEKSQNYPIAALKAIYPTKGNFIGFIGNVSSGGLVRRAIDVFRKHGKVPSEGAAMPAAVPGIGWSDHWAFWQADYDAIMVTDTAPFRYEHYHEPTDTPDKLTYEPFARVVEGMRHVIEALVE